MLQRYLASTIVQEWAVEVDRLSSDSVVSMADVSPLAADMAVRLIGFIESPSQRTYHEQLPELQRIATETKALLIEFKLDATKIPVLFTVPSRGDK